MKGQLPLSVRRLRGQGVEVFGCSKTLVSPLYSHLPFLNHVHELDPNQRIFGPIKQKYQNRYGISEKLLNLQDLYQMWASEFRRVRCGNLMRMPTEAAHGQVSSTNRCPRGSEPVNSIKIEKTTFSSKKYGSISRHFVKENLKRKRTISLSSWSIAVSVLLLKRTQFRLLYT